ncbi:hypothetical protein cyc_08332 [Cyclospora cayetanensis]|uniref:Transmembrane protein n=1 Tax=Cyclospora cayetanensis TaxID=88456 RepID=A0A1D3D0H4_9EIME|nr:hypothetical protein cyc_08332 [Cyclospora cayetanensis]
MITSRQPRLLRLRSSLRREVHPREKLRREQQSPELLLLFFLFLLLVLLHVAWDCQEALFWIKQCVGLLLGSLFGCLQLTGFIYVLPFLVCQVGASVLWLRAAKAYPFLMDFFGAATEAIMPTLGIFCVCRTRVAARRTAARAAARGGGYGVGLLPSVERAYSEWVWESDSTS